MRDGRAEGAARPSYSVSSLMVYEACPFQYHSAFVKGIPPPISRAMLRGTSVHALIAEQLKGAEPMLPPEVEPEVASLLERFKGSRFNRPALHSEEAFSLPFERGDVRGRIDLVLPRPGTGLEVVDFKSGSARPRAELEQNLQLPLYALAVSQRHGARAEDLAYTYYFLRDGVEVSFAPTEASFAQLSARVEGIMQAIQGGRFQRRSECTCYACRRILTWRRQRRSS